MSVIDLFYRGESGFNLLFDGRPENPVYNIQWAIIGPPAKIHLNAVSLASRMIA